MRKSRTIGILLVLALASQSLLLPVYANDLPEVVIDNPDVLNESANGLDNKTNLDQTIDSDLKALGDYTDLNNNHFYVPEADIGAEGQQLSASTLASQYNIYADKYQVKQGEYFTVYTNIPYWMEGYGWDTFSSTERMSIDGKFYRGDDGYLYLRCRGISPITFQIQMGVTHDSTIPIYNYTNKITITVSPIPNFVPEIYPKSNISMEVGNTDKLSTNIFEGYMSQSGTDINKWGVIWTSSNKNVVTIDRDGLNVSSGEIKAVGAGTARITAKSSCGYYVAYKDITVTTPEVTPTGISITSPKTSIDIGETLQLSGTVTPSNATNKGIEWSVDPSSTSIATVSSNGLLTGKGVGTARIKAVASGNKNVTAYKDITISAVVIPVTSLSLNKTDIQLSKNQTETLICTITPLDATDKTLLWKSSNTNVATVSPNGLITAVGAGTTQITATSHNGKSATCQVNVAADNIPVQGLTLDPSTITLEIDQEHDLIPLFTPSNATNQAIKWSVTNSNIVKCVDGKLTAVSVGTTSVTATSVDGNKRGRCVVTVVPAVKTIPATDISISSTYESIIVGDKVELSYQLFPSDATDSVRWKIFDGDEEIISNDGNGVFTALKEGFATVYVESIENSDIVAYCDIEVLSDKIPATEIHLSSNYEEIAVGESVNLSYELNPSDATDKIVWGIFDDESESIVSLDGDGTFTGLSEGFATVYAVSEGNNEIIDYCDIYVTK